MTVLLLFFVRLWDTQRRVLSGAGHGSWHDLQVIAAHATCLGAFCCDVEAADPIEEQILGVLVKSALTAGEFFVIVLSG